MKPNKPRAVFADGFSISIQASRFAYCQPREDSGPYYMVECGFPVGKVSQELLEYAENRSDPENTVYAYVPIALVRRELLSHGTILLNPPMLVEDFLESL